MLPLPLLENKFPKVFSADAGVSRSLNAKRTSTGLKFALLPALLFPINAVLTPSGRLGVSRERKRGKSQENAGTVPSGEACGTIVHRAHSADL